MDLSAHECLQEQQYVVLLLRLLVDSRRQIIHGDVGGAGDNDAHERWIHFHGPDRLLAAVQGLLAEITDAAGPSGPNDP